VAGACVADFGDPLLAQPPERVEEPRREGVVAVVDLLAGVVLAGHPVFVQTMRDGLVAGGLSGRARGGSEGFQVTGLLGDGGVPDRHAPDGVQQQRRQRGALGAGLGGEVEEAVGADRAVAVVVDRDPHRGMSCRRRPRRPGAGSATGTAR